MSDGHALGYGLAAGFTTIIVIVVAHWLLTAIITAIVAHSKGRNAIGWGILGLLLGFVGLITVLLLSRTVANEARRNIKVQQRQAEIARAHETRGAGGWVTRPRAMKPAAPSKEGHREPRFEQEITGAYRPDRPGSSRTGA